jgi:hypothetical protein
MAGANHGRLEIEKVCFRRKEKLPDRERVPGGRRTARLLSGSKFFLSGFDRNLHVSITALSVTESDLAISCQ